MQMYPKNMVVRSVDLTPGIQRLLDKGLTNVITIVEHPVSIFSEEYKNMAHARIDEAKEHLRVGVLQDSASLGVKEELPMFSPVTAENLEQAGVNASNLHQWFSAVEQEEGLASPSASPKRKKTKRRVIPQVIHTSNPPLILPLLKVPMPRGEKCRGGWWTYGGLLPACLPAKPVR
jgi:hypothetical protein